MYILDFRGRVTQASIRNFQAVRAENGTSSLSFVCVCVCVNCTSLLDSVLQFSGSSLDAARDCLSLSWLDVWVV